MIAGRYLIITYDYLWYFGVMVPLDFDATEVKRLAAHGETMSVEFKRSTKAKPLSDRDLIEAVACLANGGGGVLLMGVDDDGTISGFVPPKGKIFDARALEGMIANRTNPPLITKVSAVDVDDKQVIVIAVDMQKSIIGTSDGVYKTRALDVRGRPECRPFDHTELVAAALESSDQDWATIDAPGLTLDDLDEREFDRFRRLAEVALGGATTSAMGPWGTSYLARASSTDILRALRLVNPASPNVLRRGAALLFGTPQTLETWVQHHEVAFQHLDGTRIVANEKMRLPLFQVAEEVFDKVRAELPVFEVHNKMQRVAVPAVTDRSLREVLANALIHRDYFQMAEVRVEVTSRSLEVSNPGGLPRGIRLANIITESRPRSGCLAEAFRRAGFVDRTGRGVHVMFAERLATGMAPPSYQGTDTSMVRVKFALEPPHELFYGLIGRLRDQGLQLSLGDQLLMWHLVEVGGQCVWSDYVDRFSSVAWAFPESLGALVESGLIKITGTGEERTVGLSAYFRQVTNPATSTMTNGELTERILQLVRTRGSIARKDVIAELGLEPQTASRKLRELRDAGVLEQRGERRGTYYVPGQKAGRG